MFEQLDEYQKGDPKKYMEIVKKSEMEHLIKRCHVILIQFPLLIGKVALLTQN